MALYPDDIFILRSKGKLIKLILLCAVCIALGIFNLVVPNVPGFRHFTDSDVQNGIGFIFIVVFGLFIIYPIKKLFDNTPCLIISKEGILDRSSMVSISPLSWEDIESIKTTKQSNAKFVTILLYEPQKFIDGERSLMKRQTLIANYRRTGSPINISTNILAIEHEELKSLLEERLLRYRVEKLGENV